ncbi:hypothetical protein OG474_28395 [Kribbella sp. NBC_01505]|uniref:hypothetical protein n=1 Tax=Kribbella sp. NBC_01505 TaxID=2903580 RepID=UPI00386C145D
MNTAASSSTASTPQTSPNAPGSPEDIQVEQTGSAVIARYRSDGVLVTLQLVKPTDAGRVPFHAEIVGRAGVVSSDIRLDADYVVPGLKVFLNLLATGQAPLDAAALLAPITVLEEISRRLG